MTNYHTMRQSTVSDIRKRAHNDALHHSVIIADYPNNVSGVTNVYIRAWRSRRKNQGPSLEFDPCSSSLLRACSGPFVCPSMSIGGLTAFKLEIVSYTATEYLVPYYAVSLWIENPLMHRLGLPWQIRTGR